MRVESSRLGSRDAEPSQIYTAPEGIPGFTGRRFLIEAPEGLSRPFWLQSLEDPSQSLLLIDPVRLDPTYAPAPNPATTLLGESALLVRVVAWPAEEEGKLYANLFSPVWIAPEGQRLAQLPMVGSGQLVKAVFELSALG